jgi:hypothetical protein
MITAPLMVMAQTECRYDSPIDGTVITTWAQRRDDLDRNHCMPYDPEMKRDGETRLKDSDAALARHVDEHVERTIEKMDSHTRGTLYNEMAHEGKTVEYWRGTQ